MWKHESSECSQKWEKDEKYENKSDVDVYKR